MSIQAEHAGSFNAFIRAGVRHSKGFKKQKKLILYKCLTSILNMEKKLNISYCSAKVTLA